jgi:hypothetical protein
MGEGRFSGSRGEVGSVGEGLVVACGLPKLREPVGVREVDQRGSAVREDYGRTGLLGA